MKAITKTIIGLGALGAGYALYRTAKNSWAERPLTDFQIHGHVAPGFEPVREAFFENFTDRNELGGGCAVYHHGEKVVDLWGGVRDRKSVV